MNHGTGPRQRVKGNPCSRCGQESMTSLCPSCLATRDAVLRAERIARIEARARRRGFTVVAW